MFSFHLVWVRGSIEYVIGCLAFTRLRNGPGKPLGLYLTVYGSRLGTRQFTMAVDLWLVAYTISVTCMTSGAFGDGCGWWHMFLYLHNLTLGALCCAFELAAARRLKLFGSGDNFNLRSTTRLIMFLRRQPYLSSPSIRSKNLLRWRQPKGCSIGSAAARPCCEHGTSLYADSTALCTMTPVSTHRGHCPFAFTKSCWVTL